MIDNIIKRLQIARVYYKNINGSIIEEHWQNALISGIPFTSMFGSLLNLTQIDAAHYTNTGIFD